MLYNPKKALDIIPMPTSEKILNIIARLPKSGIVKLGLDGFSYVDIDDDFIHLLQPELKDKRIIKPDYFNEETHYIGAHISITYPEEQIFLDSSEQGAQIYFAIQGLFSAKLLNKTYYILKVESPEVLAIRAKYGLADQLQLTGHLIDLHITIAVQYEVT
jgi:hypothetical protein